MAGPGDVRGDFDDERFDAGQSIWFPVLGEPADDIQDSAVPDLQPLPDPSLIHLAGALDDQPFNAGVASNTWPPTGMPLSRRLVLSFLPCCVRR